MSAHIQNGAGAERQQHAYSSERATRPITFYIIILHERIESKLLILFILCGERYYLRDKLGKYVQDQV